MNSLKDPRKAAATAAAGAVLSLASDETKWITGHTLPVDGGYLAR